MKINSVHMASSLNFGNALSTKQEKDYLNLMNKIKEVEGRKDGIRVMKLYTQALPSDEKSDTGIGKVNSKEAQTFYHMSKVYGGATAIKYMPMGQLTDLGTYNNNHKPGCYDRSSLTLGEDIINIPKLATKEYGNIVPENMVSELVQDNKNVLNEMIAKYNGYVNPQCRINYRSILGWKNQEDYPVNDILRVAYNNVMGNGDVKENDQIKKLRAEFEDFKKDKEKDEILTRVALWPWFKDWGTGRVDKKYSFAGFDSGKPDPATVARYEELKIEQQYQVDFFKFKQFLAEKTLKEGVDMAHKEGLEVFGDAPIGFSWPEIQMFPDAFLGENCELGRWGKRVMNFYDLKDDKSHKSAAHKILRAKIKNMLEIYDGLRIDVGWMYMTPAITKGGWHTDHFDAGYAITDYIEQVAKEVKKDDFDQRKIIYECDAIGDDFNLFTNAGRLHNIKGMAVLSTVKEHEGERGPWGNFAFLKENIGLKDDDFILGTNNHDEFGVLNCAENPTLCETQVGAMQRTFKIREQDGVQDGWKLLKNNNDIDDHKRKYTRARFAEVDYAKNQFILFTDFLGRADMVDYHTDGSGENGSKDYRMRMERNFEENAHRAWQYGVGYNQADIKYVRSKFDKTYEKHKDLYDAAQKYAEYIKLNGNIYTREQADNSKYANLDIEKMSLDEIRSLDRSA